MKIFILLRLLHLTAKAQRFLCELYIWLSDFAVEKNIFLCQHSLKHDTTPSNIKLQLEINSAAKAGYKKQH
jgi:hypothetical protein